MMTTRQLVTRYWSDLPEWQQDANVEYIEGIHELLTDDGLWYCPMLDTTFYKVPNGWELRHD